MKKPVRRVRRSFRKKFWQKGKGRGRTGKGKRMTGKGLTALVAEMSDDEYETTFFSKGRRKGKGKSSGKRSTGKSFGRRRNPIGKDGQVMKCWNMKPAEKGRGKCGSTEHLARDCPYKGTGRGSSSTFWGDEEGPHIHDAPPDYTHDYQDLHFHDDTDVFMMDAVSDIEEEANWTRSPSPETV